MLSLVIFVQFPLFASALLTGCSSFNYVANDSASLYVYAILTGSRDFSQALTACSSLHSNSTLMIGRDVYVAELMRNLNPGASSDYWIGLYQSNSLSEPGGNWFWVDSKPINTYFVDWAYGEPSDTTNTSQCGMSFITGYHDVPCSRLSRSLCEVNGK
jgi:hypothetical protein